MLNSKSFFKNFKNTIGYLLFKKIFFGYILLVLILTGYQIVQEFTFSKEIVLKNLTNAEVSFGKVLAQTVWHFDEEKIKSDVKAIIDAKIIDGILILTPSKEVLVLEGVVSKNDSKYKKFVFDSNSKQIDFSDELISHKFKLIDKVNSPDEVLGEVFLYIEEHRVTEIAKESISLIVINAIISALILWFLFIYFANKLLTIPLNKFIEATQDLTLKEYKEVKISLNTEKTHELNTLVDTFNNMSKRINETYTNLKQVTLIQAKQKKDLEEANQYKNDFLANMSHELKTPLNSINVISSVMMKNKNSSLDEKQVKNLNIINSCGNDLLYLINDVLDISKLEAGEVSLNYAQIDLKELMSEIKDMFEPQVLHKNLNFIYEYDNSIGDIYSDENRIKQIIKNLLSNALKFVTKGDISFIIRDKKDDIEILVKDNGIGIASDKLEHIFDRFKQADGSTTRKYGGTGLGLAICKELSLLLKGNISVISTIDVGTEFVLILPKNKEKVKIVGDNTEVQKNKEVSKSALVLNNDPISFLSIVVELKKSYEVIQTANIFDFIKKYQDVKYSIVIIDISKLSIEELTKLSQILNKDCFLIYKDEIPEIIKNKVKESFQKPINKELLFSKINTYKE